MYRMRKGNRMKILRLVKELDKNIPFDKVTKKMLKSMEN